jgi:transcriptional regulator with XRE-family HTH domain
VTDAELAQEAVSRCGSQRKLAGIVGVNRVTIARWVRGDPLKSCAKITLRLLLTYPRIFEELSAEELPGISSIEQRLRRLENLLPESE